MTNNPYIPVVDIGAIRGTDAAAKQRLAKELDAALRTSGFCYLANHGIPQNEIEDAFRASADFFAQPFKIKQQVKVDHLFRGYTAATQKVQQRIKYSTDGSKVIGQAAANGGLERFTFGLELPDPPAEIQGYGWLYGPNNWPSSPPGFPETIYRYFESTSRLGSDVLRAVALALGIDEHFFADKYTYDTATSVLNYFPPLSQEAVAAGVESSNAHCDFSCITLLYQDEVGGLQVMERSTGQWIDAPPIEGTFVMNVGDLLARWSNDRYVSTLHRVKNESGRERYSIPLFYNPTASAIIDPRDLGLSEQECLYPPVRSGEYQRARYEEAYLLGEGNRSVEGTSAA